MVFGLALSGCGQLSLELASKINDFAKTEIIVGGSNLANGISDMIIVVHLKNSDNSPVVDYKPTYNVTPLSGMTNIECSKSTGAGISVCVLRSTVAGFKNFKLTNAKVGLQKDVEFINPSKGQILSIVAGANHKMQTPAGHLVSLSAGDIGTGVKAVTSGGYKVSLTVKTTLDSQ